MSFFARLPLLFTVFIDSLGFGFVFPLFPPLIMGENSFLSANTSTSMRGLILGLLISIFCMGQFFGGPLWGALSDRKGRKKILCITVVISAISYILGAVSLAIGSLVLLMLARLITGTAAGNFAIAQSIMADSSAGTERAKNFGLVGMAWGLGFIVGPYIGGELAHAGSSQEVCYSLPFWCAAGLCGVNFILAACFLRETVTQVRKTPFTFLGSIRDLKKAFVHPILRGIFIVSFIFSLGWGFFTEFSSLFLMDRFSFNAREIGHFYAYAGCWVALCQGVLIRPFIKRFAPQQILKGAFLALGILLLTFLTSYSPSILLITVPLIVLPEALIYPNAAMIVSSLSSAEEQGEMLGIHNSVQWAAIGLIPFFSGSLVALYPHLPITIASCTMFIAFVTFLFFFKKPLDLSGNKQIKDTEIR